MKAAALVVLALLLAGCGTTPHVSYDYERVAVDAAAHKGEVWAFTGRVIDAGRTSRGFTVQVLPFGDEASPVLLVDFPFSDSPVIAAGDDVDVLGEIRGETAGINGFGGPARAVWMDGYAIVGPNDGGILPSRKAEYDAWTAGTLPLGAK